MAYTIQFFENGLHKLTNVSTDLRNRILKDGRFTCSMYFTTVKTSKEDKKIVGKTLFLPGLIIRNVRLTKKRPYCGNHPGECQVSNKPKPNSIRLEWNDWINFHKLVNTSLNKYKTDANVWTLPYDIKGRMWIRKHHQARIRFDWTEHYSEGRLIRLWNPGTPDQFIL